MLQTPITITLIALNTIIFFVTQNNNKLVNLGILWPYVMKEKREYYRFVSSGFLHADLMHLFFDFSQNLTIEEVLARERAKELAKKSAAGA
jgi:membrane associated rhomboid family serine protease